MYTTKERARMMRLFLRLQKNGYKFYGIHDGFGSAAIFTVDHKYVSHSEQWVWDYVSGKLSSHDIVKALRLGKTPYEIPADSERKKRVSAESAKSSTCDQATLG